jgi:hypothetical protein
MGPIGEAPVLLDIRQAAGSERMALVSIQDERSGSGLPQSLYMKHGRPDTFYVFAGLNHAARLSGGRVRTPALPDQVDEYVAAGCEGLKMIEGKPTSRQKLNVPVTDAYYADYWAHVEALGLPIVWHVADPEEFWDAKRLPAWARDRGWGYGPDDVTKEQLYAEVDAVLARYPQLKIIFAHFYFLSADLSRARRFLDAHPAVRFDLTPGVEMLYNLSRNPDTSRDFFITYADRIIFGTDIASRNTVDEGRVRAGLVYRWLETEDTFRVPTEADFLLGQPDDGVIRGMALPDDVLERIYRTNFMQLVGGAPRELNVARAVSLCTRIGAIAQGMSGTPAEDSEAIRIARYLDQSG